MSEYLVNVDNLVSSSAVSVPFYFLSVPSAEIISADFKYNYYTRDEGISEETNLDAIDADSDQYLFVVENWEKGARPRQVDISFSNYGSFESEILDVGTISNAYSENKIIYEDAPFNNGFTGIIINDTSIDEKIYQIGSVTEDADLPYVPTTDFLNVAKLQSAGIRFSKSATREQIVNSYENDVKTINLGVSLNNLFCSDIVNTINTWQFSAFADEFAALTGSMQTIQDSSRVTDITDLLSINEGELDISVPTISETYLGLSTNPPEITTTRVGYIVEKYGEQLDGSVLRYDDIIVEDASSTWTDYNVRYGGVYKYKIRTVYKTSVMSLSDTGRGYDFCEVLIASTGARTTVSCVENIPPPPPVDISFQQTLTGLYIRWNFPVNPQKDIKRFQVFRRAAVERPFTLLREINFDRTIYPYTSGESVPGSLVDYYEGPVKNYLDSDFSELDSDFIYAICAIDAHGLSSAFSEQFRVRFDKITGKILITRISPAGAPKPYPNVNITEDFFSDLIKDSGHSRVRVYFDPEYTDVTRLGRSLSLISTTTVGAATYRLCMTELNLGQNQNIDIVIGDNRIGADGIPPSIGRFYTAG